MSINTVSNVLNNKEGARISEATLVRVRRIAEEMGYYPNAVARSLRRQSNDVIGLYLHGRFYGLDLRNPFYVEIIHGLDQGCEAHRKDLLLHGSFRGGSVDDIFAQLVNGQISGLALFSPSEDPLVRRLALSHLPVVSIGLPVPTMPSVVVDDGHGARMLAHHLYEKGHRRVLFLGGDPVITFTTRRSEAFLMEAATLGMQVTVEGPYFRGDFGREALEAHFRNAGSEVGQSGLRTLTARDRPTAIVCWYDGLALTVLEACLALGIDVPGDVAVTGFDGIEPPVPAARRLTTVRAPWSEVGRIAIDVLMSQSDQGAEPEETVLPVELVVGDTT